MFQLLRNIQHLGEETEIIFPSHFSHDDSIKWEPFPRYMPFVRGIHRWPVNSPDKRQWRGALTFSLICAWINGKINTRDVGDLRRHCARYDVIVKLLIFLLGSGKLHKPEWSAWADKDNYNIILRKEIESNTPKKSLGWG